MRKLAYGAASSGIAAAIAVVAVVATTEIEGHRTAPQGNPPVAAPSPGRPSGARVTPDVRASPQQPTRVSQSAGPVLAAALNAPRAATRAPSGNPGPRPSHSQAPPSSTPTHRPSSTPSTSTPSAPPSTPTPAPTSPPPTAATSPSPASCVLGVNALGITVCVPDRLGG